MGLFNLFSKKVKIPYVPFDWSLIQTDFHSHLLPHLDDGVESFEEAIGILKIFESLGIQKVITTPHVMTDFYKNDVTTIQNKFQELIKHSTGISLELDFSAEYYFDEHLIELYDRGELKTFGKNHFLFELSYYNEPAQVQEFVFRAMNDGFKPILAHPERYPYWHGKMDWFKQLKDSGCEFQINALSFRGVYSESALIMAEKFIETGLIDYIGTDCHNTHQANKLKGLKMKKNLHDKLQEMNLLKNACL